MNTALYYFSGTGNSLSIVRTIKEHLPESEIFPIIGSIKKGTHEVKAQRIGIIFPMHFMTVPRIVREFMEVVKFQNPDYVFAIVTGASPRFGNALNEVEKYLLSANVKLNAGYFVPMVAAHFPFLKVSKAKQTDVIYQEAKEKALQICESISQMKNEFDNEYTFVGKLKNLVSKETTGNEKFFTLDDGCIRCGYCMHVCPFNNIKLLGREVQWLNNCHSCFACLHYCSQGVIQYKKSSVGKPRIHHTSVSLDDISQQRG